MHMFIMVFFLSWCTVVDNQTQPIQYLVMEHFWEKTNVRFRLREVTVLFKS